jgi:AcrR family transcriptional regulator
VATTSTSSPPARLTKEARRDQLLDAAAEIISQRGVAAATMERVAEQAGVSKALPYQHFENAPDLVSALYWREMTDLAARVTVAVESAGTNEERARAGVTAFFDSVGQRAPLLVALGSVPSSPAAGGPEQRQLSHEFVVTLLRDNFGTTAEDAKACVGILLGALTAAVESWAYGDASRRALEAAAVRVFLACVSL